MNMSNRAVVILVVLFSIVVLAADAGEITIEAVDSGNYDWEGDHSPTNTYYPAGDVAASGYNEIRNFFVFDLSRVEGPVRGVTLELYNPSDPPDPGNGYRSPDPFETYAVWEVVTDVGALTAGGTGLTGIFEDLGGGIDFGQIDMTEADNGTIVAIPLNQNAENSIEAAAGGLWAVGGAVMTIDGTPLQVVFSYANGGMPRRLRMDLANVVFADGFEDGTTDAWAAVVP